MGGMSSMGDEKKDIISADYYMGIDMGTNSIGWAVTDTDYILKQIKGLDMWGALLFEEAKTAEGRRSHRSSKRNSERKKDRLNILQELFAKEISKIDKSFFQRLHESRLHIDDKSIKGKFSLFNDKDYKDYDFHKDYPTLFHLRNKLCTATEKLDIRLVYLAIHHILKNRGHFLFSGEFKVEENFETTLNNLIDKTKQVLDFEIELLDSEKIQEILKDTQSSLNDKKQQLIKQFKKQENKNNQNIQKAITHVVLGSNITPSKIFTDIEFDSNIKIGFKSQDIEELLDDLSQYLDIDQLHFIESMKALYDWAVLEEILDNEKLISTAKVKSYNEHGRDLVELKRLVKNYLPKEYKEIFKAELNKKGKNSNSNNYSDYIGEYSKTSREDFYKFIKKKLKNIKKENNNYDEKIVENFLLKIENSSFLPLQRNRDNGVIPHQLHLTELKLILKNASKHYPFLKEKDSEGYSINYKIEKLMTFKIPYYVGPLNDAHKSDKFAWVERKERGKVYPWNFEEKVDIAKSAEKFICQMTNKCQYLIGKDVLPKHSLIYSEFSLLNELNNIKVDSKKLPVKIKQDIFEELFKEKEINVTQSKLKTFFEKNNIECSEITGIDSNIKTKLQSYHALKKIVGSKVTNRKVMEEIILWSTLFNGEEEIFKSKIENKYRDLFTKEEIEKLSKLRFKEWGRLSKEFLVHTRELDVQTGEVYGIGIKEKMYETQDNLMEILSKKYKYMNHLEAQNQKYLNNSGDVDYDSLKELALSPANKRSVWNAIKIVKEITKIMGQEPKKIFIEMARGSDGSGKKSSRKKQLDELYEKIKEEEDLYNVKDQLKNEEESRLRSKKLFLYYTQLGRCMYTGEEINIDELFKNNVYPE